MTITVPSIAGLPVASNVFGLASANPWMAGFSALRSLLGGSSVKVSKAAASGESLSGQADFLGKNNIRLKKSLVDLTDPLDTVIIAAAVVGAIYAYKKFLR